MDKRGNFSFVLLIVIIIRAASSWLQQHGTSFNNLTKYADIALVGLFVRSFVRSLACSFTLCLCQNREICVYIWFLVLCLARTSGPLSLICLIFIMPFYTNVTSVCALRLNLHTAHNTHTQVSLVAYSFSIAQGQSQWIVLKSKPNKMQIHKLYIRQQYNQIQSNPKRQPKR